ncbi:sensor histidine kinase [Anaerosinus massiliensis]|uniref:sensor histidine kinase n=1 Tax=Massilibacillus massiliensis TaxID=1806837 RepID=UPI000A911246|nr:HAMP domain-containing sensor histidine kinase [Massilibacillus massiliensis]
MFKKLRLKLTLINVSVIVTLFIILGISLFYLLKMTSQQGSLFVMQKITNDVLSKQNFDLPDDKKTENSSENIAGFKPPPKPNFFFVKVAIDGNVIMYSNGLTIPESKLPQLLKKIANNPATTENFTFETIPFAYMRTILPEENYTLIVFHDKTEQTERMNEFMTHLLLVGLFCSLLSFFASYFLAKSAIKPIQASLEQQKHFVSDASHELRTPITIIQTNLDIIKGAPSHETIAANEKWLNNIQAETTNMTELINSLLFLARADANQQLLEKEYFPLNPLITETMQSFEVIAKRKCISLHTEMKTTLTALGDAARLKQVLTILLDNAIRHTPEHGEIIAGGYEKDDRVHITITDTGEGIAAKHLDKIFERFYQVDESRNKGGSGLGLSMAKWIIEKHGGTIHVKSTLGEGTTFTIKLPTKTNKQ